MVDRLVRSEDAGCDLQVLFEHLIERHLGFAEVPAEALPLAAACMGKIHAAMARLGKQPHQGTLEPALLPDIRHVTKDRAISYFTDDDAAELVTVLAIFFGTRDHQRAMLKRIMGG